MPGDVGDVVRAQRANRLRNFVTLGQKGVGGRFFRRGQVSGRAKGQEATALTTPVAMGRLQGGEEECNELRDVGRDHVGFVVANAVGVTDKRTPLNELIAMPVPGRSSIGTVVDSTRAKGDDVVNAVPFRPHSVMGIAFPHVREFVGRLLFRLIGEARVGAASLLNKVLDLKLQRAGFIIFSWFYRDTFPIVVQAEDRRQRMTHVSQRTGAFRVRCAIEPPILVMGAQAFESTKMANLGGWTYEAMSHGR